VGFGEAADSTSAFSPKNLPLLPSLIDFTYDGAFRVSSSTFGESKIEYSNGSFVINPVSNSIIVSGHDSEDAIAEFAIPEVVNTTDLTKMSVTSNVIQPFKKIFPRTETGNPQNINFITGMYFYNESLIVNGVQYYDGNANNTHTTVSIEDASNFSAGIHGFHEIEVDDSSSPAHAAGWISPIPAEWQSELGGDLIFGFASNVSIIGRLSVGPSAFIVDSDTALLNINSSTPQTIPTSTALDFNLRKFLHNTNLYSYEDGWNTVGSNRDLKNNLWTWESKARYGFIVPGTRTYVTIGVSGGHNSGVGYKITQDDGYLCGGYCAYEADDYYNYYWLWDVNDLVKVKNGEMLPYEPRPYAYGELPTPDFENEFSQIMAVNFDSTNNKLYMAFHASKNNPIFTRYSYTASQIVVPKPPAPISVD